MDNNPQCYILRFSDIGQSVSEQLSFKGFTIYGHGGHLGHVPGDATLTIYITSAFPYIRILYIQFGLD